MSTSAKIQSAEDFLLNEVVITFDNKVTKLNLTRVVSEINLYESIQSVYLTGSVIIQDDNDIIDLFNFKGTERLYISFSLPVPNFTPIVKHFVIQNIEQPIKVNDHTTIVTLNIIEDIGFLGSVDKFSKMYVGSGEQIIGKIVKDKLNRSIYNWDERTKRFGAKTKTFTPSKQGLFEYIVPNINVFEALSYVKNKMTTQNGMPYFVHSSITTNDIVLRDLETILNGEAFNRGTPFVFSQSTTNQGAVDPKKDLYAIYQFDVQFQSDTMLLAQLGAMGSYYNFRNLSTGEKISGQLNGYNIIKSLVDNGVIPNTEPDPLISKDFVPIRQDNSLNTDKKLQNYTSRHFRNISGSTFIDDVNNFAEEDYINQHRLHVISYILMQYLVKDLYTIRVPGFLFLSDIIDRSVGNLIELRTFKTAINNGQYNAALSIDSNKSGNFVMLQKRHIFNCLNYKHTVVVECGRITKKKPVQQ